MEVERAQTRKNGFIALGVLSVLMPTLFFVNLYRDRHRHEEGMEMMPSTAGSGAGSSDASASVRQPASSLLPVLENEDELTITPIVTKPSRHDVAFSIGAVRAEARRCLGAVTRMELGWQVNPDGSASDIQALVDAGAPEQTKAFLCVKESLKTARVSPFEGAAVHVTYTLRTEVPR
jgi:hypothetical protein